MILRIPTAPFPTVAHKFARFLLTGGVCTLIQYVLLIVLIEACGMSATPASTVGYLISALVNYYLSRSFTFRSHTPHAQSLPRFALVTTFGLVLNDAVMFAGTTGSSIHYLVVQAAATGSSLLWNFSANLYWTFGREQS